MKGSARHRIGLVGPSLFVLGLLVVALPAAPASARRYSEKREACTRNCFCRRVGIHVLISFSNWPEDVEEFTPAWEEVLRSLRVGEFVDPKTGWRIR